MSERVRVVRPSERVLPSVVTPGMRREEALASDGFWMGVTEVDAGVVTGWHHHGEFDTYVHVLSGTLILEYGPGGLERVEGAPGDFIHIPAGVVHREGTSEGSAGMQAVVVRLGSGEITINVGGPDEA